MRWWGPRYLRRLGLRLPPTGFGLTAFLGLFFTKVFFFHMCQVSVTLLVIAFVIVDAFVMVFILYAMSKRVCKKTNDVFVISFVFLMPLTLSLSLHTLSKRGCRKYNRTNTLKSCLLLVQVHSAIALMTILAMVAHLMMTLWHYGTT